MKRFHVLILGSAMLASAMVSQDRPDQEQPFQIQVDVTGKALPRERSRDQWGALRTQNLLVVGNASDEDLRTAASELELFRDQFAGVFPRARNTSSVATRVVVFKDRKDLKTFRPEGFGDSDAYFKAGPDLDYIVLKGGDSLEPQIMRGYAQALLRDSISPLPLWLAVGIEEYFGAYKLTRLGNDRMVKLGIDEYPGGISEKNLMPLPILMSIDRDGFEQLAPDVQKMFYAESCAFFQYLMQTRRLAAAVRLAGTLAEGQSSDVAFRAAFKVSPSVMQENLRHHIQMSKYSGWSISLRGLSLDQKKKLIRIVYGRGFMTLPVGFDNVRAAVEALPIRPLSEAEADYYRGDLQLHNGRLAEAEGFLKRSIDADATQAQSHASLGWLQSQRAQHADALESLDRARILDPAQNYLGYFYTAMAIRRRAEAGGSTLSQADLDEMEAALRDAVDIAPDFVEAAEFLGETQLLLGRNPNDSARLLMGALQRSPGRTSLILTLARIVSSVGDKASSGWMLQRVIRSGASTSAQRDEARLLLARLHLTPEERTAFGDFGLAESASPAATVEVRALTRDQLKKDSREMKTDVVRGRVTNVECSKGITIYIQLGQRDVDQRIENLRSDSPANIEWISDTGELLDAVECGESAWGRPAAITYIPKRKGLTLGEPLVVEFCRGASFDCDVRLPPPLP